MAWHKELTSFESFLKHEKNGKRICINLNDIRSGNLKCKKNHEVEVFLLNNILYSLLKCIKFYRYIKSQVSACAF